MKWQGKSKRKETGGKLKLARKKRKYELGTELHLPSIGNEKLKKMRTKGGNEKVCILVAQVANVTDPKTHETKKVTIEDVLENPANPHYVRRDIVTKGAIIQTEIGKARVTSRPGQDGCVNAVLIE